MASVRKPVPDDHSILGEMLAIRLQQLEAENGGTEAFLPDDLTAAIAKKNRADRAVAWQARSRKLPT
jgi:hypothetical protein